MSRPIYEVQRDFALNSGLRSQIIWDSLAPDQADILKEKIKTLLPNTGNKNGIEEVHATIFNNIWLQRKYTNRILLSAIIYVMVTEETNKYLAKHSTKYTCHPVFRTRKCMNADNSSGCCMIFIDEHGRIYQNWKHYKNKNILPKGTMVAPQNGIYDFNYDDEVVLEFQPTPSADVTNKILSTSDTVAGVGGLLATVPIITALSLPIAVPIMVAATFVTLSTAAYSTVRSAMQLDDRRRHGQSIALTDRTARNNWISVIGGSVGLGATGATRALTYASAVGSDITMASKIAVGGFNVSSLVLSGTGIVNGVYDLYLKINDNEKLTSMDILQLASSLVVFTHSINNLKLVSTISTTNSGSSIRNILRRQISKTFSKIIQFNGRGVDVVRVSNEIPIPNVLAGVLKKKTHGNISPNVEAKISTLTANTGEIDYAELVIDYGAKFVRHISNANSLLDLINVMRTCLCESGFKFMINLTKAIVQESIDSIDRALKTFVSTESILYKIFTFCVENYKELTDSFLEKKTCEIVTAVERSFETMNPVNRRDIERKCSSCNGYYYVCNL